MLANRANCSSFKYRISDFIVCCFLAAFAHNARGDQPLLGVQGMSVGYYHSCAIVNGGARCFGYNGSGQLGNGGTTPTSAIVPVTGLHSGVTALTEGYEYSCAIATGGAMCWGTGFLGDGSTSTNSIPVSVTGLSSGVTSIAGGTYHVCVIVNGGMQCWGSNGYGELGNGTLTYSTIPVAAIGLTSGVVAIASGQFHSCAVGNGGAECWGNNQYGQLGNGDTTYASSATPVMVNGLTVGVTALAAGDAHTCAIVNGGVKCWGDNSSSQLGTGIAGFGASSTTPVDVAGLSSGAIAITAGLIHTCVLVSNDPAHPVKCWGANTEGQLGNGALVNSAIPVDVSFLPVLVAGDSVSAIAAGGQSTCALVVRSGITNMDCWGSNGYGELGVSGPPAQTSLASSVVGVTNGVSALGNSSYTYHSCAVVNGGAQCWGRNSTGQLGNGIYADTSVAQSVFGLNSGVTAIAIGFQHTCAVVNGGVQCWGDNVGGELGTGTTVSSSPTPVAVSGLSAGSGVTAVAASGDAEYFQSRSCAIVNAGMQCWGGNMFGELGIGTTLNSAVPIAVTGLSTGVTSITTGSFHTCAAVNGGAQCWGENSNGELGNGTTTDSSSPVSVTGLSAGSGVTAISAGFDHTCAIVNGGAQCWGVNFDGQLGNPAFSVGSNVPVAVTGLGSGVTAISAGAEYSCAVINGGATCWGANFYGALGNGTYANSDTPVAVIGLESGVVAITTGSYHACALMSSGAEKCWGSDQYGQLGDYRFISTPTPQVVVVGDEIFRDGFDSN